MTGALAKQINSPTQPAQPGLHVAIVLGDPPPTATRVTVRIFDDDDPVELPYQAGYTPVPGDQVNVLLLGGATQSGIVLGGRAGQAGNLVPNSDFGRHAQPQIAATKPPYLWAAHTASGQVATVAGAFSSEYQRHMMLMAINTGTAGDNYAYSAAIPVTPAETLYVDAVADALCFAPSPTTLTTRLVVGWFATASAVWPHQLSETEVASVVTDFAGGDPFWLTGSVTVPADAAFARVAIRASQTSGDLNYSLRVNHVEMTRDS